MVEVRGVQCNVVAPWNALLIGRTLTRVYFLPMEVLRPNESRPKVIIQLDSRDTFSVTKESILPCALPPEYEETAFQDDVLGHRIEAVTTSNGTHILALSDNKCLGLSVT